MNNEDRWELIFLITGALVWLCILFVLMLFCALLAIGCIVMLWSINPIIGYIALVFFITSIIYTIKND